VERGREEKGRGWQTKLIRHSCPRGWWAIEKFINNPQNGSGSHTNFKETAALFYLYDFYF